MQPWKWRDTTLWTWTLRETSRKKFNLLMQEKIDFYHKRFSKLEIYLKKERENTRTCKINEVNIFNWIWIVEFVLPRFRNVGQGKKGLTLHQLNIHQQLFVIHLLQLFQERGCYTKKQEKYSYVKAEKRRKNTRRKIASKNNAIINQSIHHPIDHPIKHSTKLHCDTWLKKIFTELKGVRVPLFIVEQIQQTSLTTKRFLLHENTTIGFMLCGRVLDIYL